MASYWEKLKDPRWQKKRLEILERDCFRCTECSDESSTLHVHHGYYERGFDPWDYDSDTLRTLCESCHEEIGRLTKEAHKNLAMIGDRWTLDAIVRIAAILPVINASGEEKRRQLAQECVMLLSYGTFSAEEWRCLPGPPRQSWQWSHELDAQISSGMGVSA